MIENVQVLCIHDIHKPCCFEWNYEVQQSKAQNMDLIWPGYCGTWIPLHFTTYGRPKNSEGMWAYLIFSTNHVETQRACAWWT